MEGMPIGKTNIATSANHKGTDRRSAGRELRRTNFAVTLKDKHIGPESISWRRTRMPNP
jgi:hypothetical protein